MRKLFLVTIFLFATLGQAQVWYYNPANGHKYTFVQTTSWNTAETMAVDLGGHLVTINDQAENDWLLDLTINETSNSRAWIGFYQLPGSGEPDQGWVWISGEPVIYTNWHTGTGEPNNSGGNEHWGEFWIRTHVSYELPGYWNDTWETHSDIPIGIVEAVPEPASFLALGLGLLAFRRKRK